jgi:hypothetical protein
LAGCLFGLLPEIKALNDIRKSILVEINLKEQEEKGLDLMVMPPHEKNRNFGALDKIEFRKNYGSHTACS